MSGAIQYEFQLDNDLFFGADADLSSLLSQPSFSFAEFGGARFGSRQYYVRARAKNSAGLSGWSVHKVIDFHDVLRPPTPSSFVTSMISNDSFRAGWTAPADTTNVRGYRILLISPSPNSYATYSFVFSAGTTFKIFSDSSSASILPDTTYTLWLQAWNTLDDGTDIYSDIIKTTVTTSAAAANVPALVQGVTAATGSGVGEIDVAWTDSADATGYKLFYVCVSPFDTGVIDVGKVASYTLNAGASALCLVGVRAYNANGDGDFSDPNMATAFAGSAPVVVPGQVTGLFGTTGLAGALNLFWEREEGATGFKIRYGTTNDPTPATVVDVGNVTEYNITGLTPGATYYCDVIGYNSAGDGPGRSNIAVVAGSTVLSVPNQVTGVTAETGTSSGEIDVGWTATTSTGYKIRYQQAGGVVQQIDVGVVIEYTLTGLVPGQTYKVWVLAYNANGDGPYPTIEQDTAMAFMDDVLINIPAIEGFTAGPGAMARQIGTAWLPAVGVEGYRLRFYPIANVSDYESFEIAASETSYVFAPVIAFEAGETFNVSIQARIGTQYGPSTTLNNITSNAVSETLATPTSFSASNITFFSAQTNWNHGDQEGDGYFVRWSTDPNFGIFFREAGEFHCNTHHDRDSSYAAFGGHSLLRPRHIGRR